MIYLILAILAGLAVLVGGPLMLGIHIGQARLERIRDADRLYRAMRALDPYQPSEQELPRAAPFPVDTAPMRALPPLSDGSAAWEALERQQRGWGW